ncbi:MAG: hypothetical protein WEE51_05195 [Pirellulaceae bacterium]
MTVFYIVCAVLALMFGVFAYLNSANWNVLHVLAGFLTVCAAFAFVILAALVLKTESAWKAKVSSLEPQLAQVQSSVEKLRTGSTIDPSGRHQRAENSTAYARGVEAALQQQLYARGRVWRAVQKGQLANNQIGVSLPLPAMRAPTADEEAVGDEEAADAGEAAAPAPGEDESVWSLDQNSVVYVFGEMRFIDPEDTVGREVRVPAYYIGEFVVRTVDGPNLTLEPSVGLDQQQVRLINRDDTWVLYDRMPIDDQEVFAGMPEENLQGLISGAFVRATVPQASAEEALNQIARHDTPAEPNDPEGYVWSRVTFQEDYTVEVDAQVESPGVRQDFEPATGLAATEFLKQGGPTEFKKGEQALLPTNQPPGKDLVDQGIVTVDERIYRRPLHDFAQEFHYGKGLSEDLQNVAAGLQRDMAMLERANETANALLAYRTQEKTKVEEDRSKIEYERQQITDYKNRLVDLLAKTLGENSGFYRANQALVTELTRLQNLVLERLDLEESETAAAEVAVPSAKTASAATLPR